MKPVATIRKQLSSSSSSNLPLTQLLATPLAYTLIRISSFRRHQCRELVHLICGSLSRPVQP